NHFRVSSLARVFGWPRCWLGFAAVTGLFGSFLLVLVFSTTPEHKRPVSPMPSDMKMSGRDSPDSGLSNVERIWIVVAVVALRQPRWSLDIFFGKSQRDFASKPRVGAQRLPWVGSL